MTRKIIQLYYPAMMVFFVFTFANDILKGVILNHSVENFLFVILWITIAIHINASYLRIYSWSVKEYPMKALISDCVDILCIVYLCSYISVLCSSQNSHSYLSISATFVIMAINQFFWFVFMRSFDIPAIFRIIVLFVGMIAVSVSEILTHSIYNLVAVVLIIAITAILRIRDKAPGTFSRMATFMWNKVKRKNS